MSIAYADVFLLCAVLRGFGSFKVYPWLTPTLVWALAWISIVGSADWIVLAIAFGSESGNILDPRVLYHVMVTLALVVFSLRGAVRQT